MNWPEGKIERMGLLTTLVMNVAAGAGAVVLTMPVSAPIAHADPPPPPPGTTTTAAPAPVDQNAAPATGDQNAPPPPPEPGRVEVPAGGFSYVIPPGWTAGDASRISYGQAVLLKTPAPGQPPATDTSILLGKLDLRLFAGAEPDNQKAAIRLASDMGEFYMPFPGTRINQETVTLNAAGMPGAAAYYEVKFTDTNKPDGQIWAAALGTQTPRQGAAPAQNNRWFVVWLGSAGNPIDKAAAKTLAESIRPFTPPPPPPPPEGQPAPPGAQPALPGAQPAPPGAPPPTSTAPPPPGAPAVGVPVPVAPENAPGMTPPQ
jgi:Fibronectin-attachment protein (FAP)